MGIMRKYIDTVGYHIALSALWHFPQMLIVQKCRKCSGFKVQTKGGYYV